MIVDLKHDGPNYIFVLTEGDFQLSHHFSAVGVYQAQDQRAYLANMLQRAINKWEHEFGKLEPSQVKIMMEAIFSA